MKKSELPGVNAHLRCEQARHCDTRRQTNCHRHRGDSQRHMIRRRKVERDKCQPNDARRIHGEANVLRFIECFGNFTCQHRIDGAHDDENDGEEEGDHVGGIDMRIAHQMIILTSRVVILCVCGRYQHPYHIYEHLRGCL